MVYHFLVFLRLPTMISSESRLNTDDSPVVQWSSFGFSYTSQCWKALLRQIFWSWNMVSIASKLKPSRTRGSFLLPTRSSSCISPACSAGLFRLLIRLQTFSKVIFQEGGLALLIWKFKKKDIAIKVCKISMEHALIMLNHCVLISTCNKTVNEWTFFIIYITHRHSILWVQGFYPVFKKVVILFTSCLE